MNSDTSRSHRSETATTSARNPACIITYTIALRRAYDARISQPSSSLHARSTNINSHTIAMDHLISITSSESGSASGSLAGPATTLMDRSDAEGQHSRENSSTDTSLNTPSSHNKSATPPKWKRSVASETAIPDPSPADALRGPNKRRKTAPPLVLTESVDRQQQEENREGASVQQPNPFSNEPPTPPSSTPTSHKSSTSTTKHSPTRSPTKPHPPTPTPSLSTTSTTPTPSFIPLPERADPLGTHARSLETLAKHFTRHNLTTRPQRRAHLYTLPHSQWADAARWLHDHRSDIWDTPEEEASEYTPLAADGYADAMRARLRRTGICWEWVSLHGTRRGRRVEVGDAQLRLFGWGWAIEEGVWEVGWRSRRRGEGGEGGVVGPRGERWEGL